MSPILSPTSKGRETNLWSLFVCNKSMPILAIILTGRLGGNLGCLFHHRRKFNHKSKNVDSQIRNKFKKYIYSLILYVFSKVLKYQYILLDVKKWLGINMNVKYVALSWDECYGSRQIFFIVISNNSIMEAFWYTDIQLLHNVSLCLWSLCLKNSWI